MKHVDYINRCIELAQKGEGWVNPNPFVGCVIVHNNEIISEGYHQQFGGNHAERNAILPILGDPRLNESTLYVNLEPCNHHGKTPPCTELIIQAKIPNVVISILDPNPLVAGSGVKRLEEAGINVKVGYGVYSATMLNRFFLNFHKEKRPYVTVKWAESRDGFIGKMEGEAIKITDEKIQKYTHKLRKAHSAILVGVNTWINDKPKLTDRYWNGPQPIKIILDPSLRGSYENVEGKTWVINSLKNENCGNLKFIKIGNKPSIGVKRILNYLYKQGINSLLVEGGKYTLEKFFKAKIFDELHRFTNYNLKLQGGIVSPKFPKTGIVFQDSESDGITHQHWDKYTVTCLPRRKTY